MNPVPRFHSRDVGDLSFGDKTHSFLSSWVGLRAVRGELKKPRWEANKTFCCFYSSDGGRPTMTSPKTEIKMGSLRKPWTIFSVAAGIAALTRSQ